MLRTESSSATLTAIHLSLLALTFAVMFGGTLAGVFGWGIAVPFMLLGDLHVGFGLLGWVGLLVVGVAYQVVPMFQMTPIYPSLLTKGLAPILFLLLCLWGVATAIVLPALGWLPIALAFLMATGYAIFSATTIYLLWRRKRKTREATSLFWLTGLTSLLLCVGLWAVRRVDTGRQGGARLSDRPRNIVRGRVRLYDDQWHALQDRAVPGLVSFAESNCANVWKGAECQTDRVRPFGLQAIRRACRRFALAAWREHVFCAVGTTCGCCLRGVVCVALG